MLLSNVIRELENDEVFKTNFLLFKKISLNYREITSIDFINSKFIWIKELYLNQNNLQNLQVLIFQELKGIN